MKQYRVEMLQDGEWIGGHDPNQEGTIIHKNYQAARVEANMCELMWKGKKNAPAGFRVASREVTEWTEEENK